MKLHKVSFFRKFLMEERGQALPVILFGLTAFLGFAGISIEVGHGYYAVQMLQASTNSAALAGAALLPNQTTAATYATNYSSIATDKNANGVLSVQSTGISTSFYCSTTVSNWGTPCQDSSGNYTSSGANAMIVTQAAKVPTWLAGMFGVPNFNITSKATAAMAGGQYTPDNIAILVDTTASMASPDPGTQTACGGKSQIACALLGAQVLLGELNPCSSGLTCTPGSKPVNTVSLFVFPSVLGTTASKDYICPTTNPTIEPYTFTDVTPGGTQNLNPPATYAYKITNWATDYRTTVGTQSLNPASQIVIAVGDSGVGGCKGVSAPGGYGTYYAQAIYQAQAALIAEQTANPGTSNVMIILSDGNATACATNGNTAAGACNSKADLVATSGKLNGTTSASGCTGTCGPTSYTYPSAVGMCGQAVVAAQAAAAAGTKVETIGYGSPNTSSSSNCGSDVTYSATVSSTTYASTGWGATASWKAGDSPCQALEAMASGVQFFYSDDGQGCVAPPPNGSNTQLNQIFGAITNGLSAPRLLPNGTA